MSKRTNIATDMANNFPDGNFTVQVRGLLMHHWLDVIYALEAKGYQVVKTSETAEYQGLRNANK